MIFLDFAKAYDKMERTWIGEVAGAMGFGPHMRRWVALLLEGTRAVVAFGGRLSRAFAVRAGVAQGSPLSPLLYVVAAQPLAAALRGLAASGAVSPIRLPGGLEAPVCHQHADDTTIHTATVDGAAAALAEAVRPFCAATGSALNVGKCEGLTLGAHPPLEGTHPGTGVTFRGPRETVRHLGVLLTTGDRAAVAREMWQRRVDAVAARARHWSGVDLSLLGRVHVAKSAMSSTVVHIASFIPAPDQQAKALQNIIDGYIYGRPPNAATDDRPLIHRPPKAAACLPRAEGGIGAPDVRLQATALLAKTAARLIHPQRRTWKDIEHARFAAELPGLGVGAMTTTLRPRQAAPGLPARLGAYWAALRATRPHRLVPPADMLAQQVAREPLAGSAAVARPGGGAQALGWRLAAAEWPGATRLGDLDWSDTAAAPAAVPQEWAAALRLPPPEAAWQASGDGRWVRYRGPSGERLYAVGADGRLRPPGAAPGGPGQHAAWRGCCVVDSPLPRGDPAGGEVHPPLRPWSPLPPPGERAPARALYVVGPWTDIAADPSLWGHGRTPLTDLTVGGATRRLVRLSAVARLGGRYSPAEAVAPALWGAALDGTVDPHELDVTAQRQQAAFIARLTAPRGRQRAPPGGRPTDDQLTSMYSQPWMHPSPARTPAAERARLREAAAGPTRPAAQCDTVDALSHWGVGRPTWRAAWRELRGHRHRPHYVFQWRLMHGGLPCGAARVSHWTPGAEGLAEAVCCGNAACRRPLTAGESAPAAWCLETVQHALLDCPAVRPALQWLAALWLRVEGGGGPPLTAAVWLVGDPGAWQPQRAHAGLWRSLRAAMLSAAWDLRTRRSATGVQFTPADVCRDFVGTVRRLVRADWLRATADITDLPGVQASWFPAEGRRQPFTVADFERRWCPGSVVAHVVHGHAGRPSRVDLRLGAPPSLDLA